MKQIFEQASLGHLQIKNRLVRSATFENGCGEEGHITPELRKVYKELAAGGVGLIVTGMMSAGHNAGLNDNMIQIYGDDFVPEFQKITDQVHDFGCKIAVQLGHCGLKSGIIDLGDHAYAPSDIEAGGKQAKAMTIDEIKALVKEYGTSAARCKEAGADAVQIHAGHGFLVSQFLSPYFNHRTDAYGGTIENRARMLIEILDEIKKCVGMDYPVLVKINYSDLVEGGNTGADCIAVCKELKEHGIDAIEVTSGISVDPASAPTQPGNRSEGFFADGALDVAEQVGVPVISIRGYRTKATVEEYLNKGKIEAISMCRPLICEPDLPSKWQNGTQEKSECVNCNQCFMMLMHGCAVKAYKNK